MPLGCLPLSSLPGKVVVKKEMIAKTASSSIDFYTRIFVPLQLIHPAFSMFCLIREKISELIFQHIWQHISSNVIHSRDAEISSAIFKAD